MKSAEIYDAVPLPKEKVQFRKRVAECDINPALRFKPKTDAERVIDFIKGGAYLELQNTEVLKQIKHYCNSMYVHW